MCGEACFANPKNSIEYLVSLRPWMIYISSVHHRYIIITLNARTWVLTTPEYIRLKVRPPDISTLQLHIRQPCQYIQKVSSSIAQSKIGEKNTHVSRKKPASLMHFTLVLRGNKLLKSSQRKIVERPPAEQPVSKALM